MLQLGEHAPWAELERFTHTSGPAHTIPSALTFPSLSALGRPAAADLFRALTRSIKSDTQVYLEMEENPATHIEDENLCGSIRSVTAQ